MEVFRLCRLNYAHPLSGKGAAIKGARWNSPGTELVYTAENRSLAMAEVAVHFSLATLPGDFLMLSIVIPEDIIPIVVSVEQLPANWNTFPPLPLTQRIGDDFALKNMHCLLRVPSAVTQGDHNILINPLHPDFQRISITRSDPFPFDKRIFKS